MISNVNLNNFVCSECGKNVYLEDGYWKCECFATSAFELNLDHVEYPSNWKFNEIREVSKEKLEQYVSSLPDQKVSFYVQILTSAAQMYTDEEIAEKYNVSPEDFKLVFLRMREEETSRIDHLFSTLVN